MGKTRREAPQGDRGTRRDTSSPSPFVRIVLPPELSRRYRVLGELAATGAEADVALVETDIGERQVLKLYRRGVAPDEEAVSRLTTADVAHVVQVMDRGWEEGCWFEVLEFCEHGSLRTLLEQRAPDVTEVVAEIAAALSHVHSLGLVHRDLKPENVLVRHASPLDAVLGDFGLVRVIDASVRWTRAWGTPAYSPPEFESGEVSAAWDWWSLGIIVAEIAGGRHPFESDGLMHDQQIRAWLAQRPVDLSAVAEPRGLLLCQGLLTRDRRHRWGAQEVEAWLRGGSPEVMPDEVVTPSRRARRVLFAGVELSSPRELAVGFQQQWGEAFRRLYQERDATLVDEVERLLRHHQLDEAIRLLAPGTAPAELPRRFADLLAELDPDLDPIYNAFRLTAEGMEAAALDVLAAGGDHPAAKVLDEVRRQNILTVWRALSGVGHGPHTHEVWAASNAKLESIVETLSFQPAETEWAVARAWLLLCALNEEHHSAQLLRLITGLDQTLAGEQSWWRDLYTASGPTHASQILALLSHARATQQTHLEQEEARRLAQERLEQEQAAREHKLARLYGSRPELHEVLSNLSEGEMAAAWPALERLGEVLISEDRPLMAWATVAPEHGVIVACTSGLVFATNRDPRAAELWTRRLIDGVVVEGEAVSLRLGGDVVEVRLVERDELDWLCEVTELLRANRSERKLLRAFAHWLAEGASSYRLDDVETCCDSPSVGTCQACGRRICSAHGVYHDGRYLCTAHAFLTGGRVDLPLDRTQEQTPDRGVTKRTVRAAGLGGWIRLDGIYYAPERDYSRFFRFVSSGTVYAVSSTGSPEDVRRWLVPGHADLEMGEVVVSASSAAATTRTGQGQVEYEFFPTADGLIRLTSHSLINGHRSTAELTFSADPPSRTRG